MALTTNQKVGGVIAVVAIGGLAIWYFKYRNGASCTGTWVGGSNAGKKWNGTCVPLASYNSYTMVDGSPCLTDAGVAGTWKNKACAVKASTGGGFGYGNNVQGQ